MLKLSPRACFALCVLVAFAAASAVCAAEEPESIYVANVKVITIRDKGTYHSTRERAIAIEEAIVTVISTQDTQHPQVTVKQKGADWSVYSGNVCVVTVSAAEAQANGVPAKSLAAIWARNLKENLPKATPCSKMPASTFQPKPGATAAAPAGAGTPPKPKPAAPVKPVETPVAPVAPVPTGPVPVAEGPPAVAAVGAPLLLVRGAFEIARSLPEEEFSAKRDEMANHLIADLTPFITGKVANSATAAPPTPRVVTPTPELPVVTPKPVTPAPKPAVTPAAPKPDATAGGEKPGDPSREKVPQKNRIREKLEQAREPYLALKKEDPQAAKPVDALLAACRNAFALGNFDQSEQYADSALALLGVK